MEDARGTPGTDDPELFELGSRNVLPVFRNGGRGCQQRGRRDETPRRPGHPTVLLSHFLVVPTAHVQFSSGPWPPGLGILVGQEGRWHFLVGLVLGFCQSCNFKRLE